MSDEPQQSKQGDQPDDSEPTPERQTEMRAAYEANVAAGKAPYEGVAIHTRGELLWVMRERCWSGEVDAEGKEHANLNGADLREANLSGTHLVEANLNRAYLRNVNLSAALMRLANLSSARLSMANLSRADFTNADLSRARFPQANLSGAKLRRVDLTGTNLYRANLSGADLLEARMDVATALISVVLDSHTRVIDVAWNGVRLGQVDWEQAPTLGDEEYVTEAKSRPDRAGACRRAARAYRGLAIALRGQGLLIPASRYRLREQRLERRALRLERKYLAWLFSGLLDLVAGYGERPVRTVIAYLVVILGFAGLFYVLGQLVGPALPPLAALVFSITSFHGRGFFPGSIPSLTDPLVVFAAAEAIIGLFIELVFIATFSRRFLGN